MAPEHPTLKMTKSAEDCEQEQEEKSDAQEEQTEPEEPDVEKSPEEKENDRINEFITSLNKQQLLSLYEKLALSDDLTDFEFKVRDKLD